MDLTPEKIAEMPAGADLDALIAKHIVRAAVSAVAGEPRYFERREDRPWEPLPYYSESLDSIWPFVLGKSWTIDESPKGARESRWMIFADHRAFEDGECLSRAPTAPLAICRALLSKALNPELHGRR